MEPVSMLAGFEVSVMFIYIGERKRVFFFPSTVLNLVGRVPRLYILYIIQAANREKRTGDYSISRAGR